VSRVLLADDDEAFREQLAVVRERLLPELDVVASVGDCHEAVAAALAHAPTHVLIDYGMPGPNGGHAALVIQQALPQARVVVVTGRAVDELTDLPAGFDVVSKGPSLEDELPAALGLQASSRSD
jgi:DNA-binding NarL/FixJ family response regulator